MPQLVKNDIALLVGDAPLRDLAGRVGPVPPTRPPSAVNADYLGGVAGKIGQRERSEIRQ